MIKMTGLKSCDTCRKAQKWLKEQELEFSYRDVKTDGVPSDDLEKYVAELGWEKVVNKASTTWRGLNDEQKSDINGNKAVALLLENPSLMKRPLFEVGEKLVLGFRDAQKEEILSLK